MHSIIFTSADHCYANALLGRLIRRGVFDGHTVLVLEQHGLIPGKTKLDGLVKYLRVSGVDYVGWQIAKQLLFQWARGVSALLNHTESPFYPYWRLGALQLTRAVCPKLSSPQALALIARHRPDVILSLYSKDIIPKSIFSLPPKGCVNLHPAPLPYYKGISPTFWMLARGEKTAGVTLHDVDAGIDTGAILAQTLFPAKGFTSEHALYTEATLHGAKLVEDYIQGITRGRNRRTKRQISHTGGSYFRLPTKVAVKEFFRRGCIFFRLRDFFQL